MMNYWKTKYLESIEVFITKKRINIKDENQETLINESIDDLEQFKCQFKLKSSPNILLKFKNGEKIKFNCYEKYSNEVNGLITNLEQIYSKVNS